MITPSPASINALLASTRIPTPLTWTPCPERGGGWWRTELTTALAATRAYEVGQLLVAADNSLQYEIIQGRRGTPQALLVGPR